jgi:hypothetical protein
MEFGGLFLHRCLPGCIEGRGAVVEPVVAACPRRTVYSEYLATSLSSSAGDSSPLSVH